MVLDEQGEPIIGANIVEKGTTNGTITDIDGNYTLTLNDLKKAVLQFSFIGYNTLEEGVKGRNKVDVKLAPSVVNLGEVVAIGYGTQTRKEITGSVANVSEENFNKGVNRDASDLLQGKVAGLQITSGSGDVTRSSQIRLRGTSTLQNDQGPMIVIDGVPGGDMSTVSPSDIESISVLKDASSAAIYGSRAAGGVILITTKRGSGAKTQINYDGYVTMDKVANKPDMLNASEWRDVNKQLGSDISQYDKYNADTDWFGALLRTGISQNHALSLSGGSSKSNYRASYTYLDRKGIARDNWMKRHSFRFQFQQRAINDRLRIGLTGAATLTDMQATFADYFIAAYNNVPVVPIYNEDGSYFTGNDNAYNQGNMVKAQDENYKLFKNNYFYGQGDVQFEVIEGLNVKANLYKSRYTSDYSQWESPDNALGGGAGNSLGDSSNGYAKRRNFVWDRELMEWTADYNKSFGAEEKHKLNALLGYSWETNGYQSQESLATQFSVASMGANSIQAGNDLKIGNVTSSKNDYKLISFFARAHYSYDERYMITATMRRDGSSKFGANHKWGWFPAASAAWRMSSLPAIKNIEAINDLKLRFSYGVTGRSGFPKYSALARYEQGGYWLDDNGQWTQAWGPTNNPNPDLHWEKQISYNLGVDFSLLKNKLSGSLDAYVKQGKEVISNYDAPLPPFMFDQIFTNVASTSSKGLELTLNWDVVNMKDFSYSTNLVASFTKSKLDKFSNGTYQKGYMDRYLLPAPGNPGYAQRLQDGVEIGSFYGLRYAGVDDNGNMLVWKDAKIGGEKILANGEASDTDKDYIGHGTPRYSLSWGNTFRYKGFDLSLYFQGRFDYQILNMYQMYYGLVAEPGMNLLEDAYGKNGHIKSGKVMCDYFLEDGDYFRLDNITLGWTPKLDTKWISNLRVYATVKNAFTITKYSVMDPTSVDINGLEPGISGLNVYPIARSFTFGIQISY